MTFQILRNFLKFFEGDYSQDHKIGFLDNYRIENVACQFCGINEIVPYDN